MLGVLNNENAEPDLFNSNPPRVARQTSGPAPIEPNVSFLHDEPSLQLHRDTRLNPGMPPHDDHWNNDQPIASYRGDTSHTFGDAGTERSVGGSSRHDLNSILDPSMDFGFGGLVNWNSTMEQSKKDRELPQPAVTKKQQKATLPPMLVPLDLGEEHQGEKYGPMASSINDSHGRGSLNTIHFQAQQPEVKARTDMSFNNDHTPADELSQAVSSKSTGVTVAPQAAAVNATMSNVISSLFDAEKNGLDEQPLPPMPAPKPKTKTGPRRPWDKDETYALIRGVGKFGVGDWKLILNCPEYKPILALKGRRPTDLKDRWRTLCPPGLQAEPQQQRRASSISDDDDSGSATPGNKQKTSKPKKSKSKRITDEEFAEISGVEVANVKSSVRRPRVQFTAEEDRKLFAAYKTYGTNWIQAINDTEYGFGHRTATDLRDRFRNRFKELWKARHAADASSPTKPDETSRSQPAEDETSRPERAQLDKNLNQLPSMDSLAYPQTSEWDSFSGPWPFESGSTGPMGENAMAGTMDINSIISTEQNPPLHPEQVKCLQNFINNADPMNSSQ